jgi:hypothetical protein
MQYNPHPEEEDFFSRDRFFAQFYRADVFGPEEEDISIHSESAFLADEPSADIVAYFRHGVSTEHKVECLRALLKREEEDSQ